MKQRTPTAKIITTTAHAALCLSHGDTVFGNGWIFVRAGKGGKDRITMLPDKLKLELQRHLERVKLLHEQDLAAGLGTVWLPGALKVKYPNAEREWLWQWVFPSASWSSDPHSVQPGFDPSPYPSHPIRPAATFSPSDAEKRNPMGEGGTLPVRGGEEGEILNLELRRSCLRISSFPVAVSRAPAQRMFIYCQFQRSQLE
jgi:hypothetical protein